MGGHGVFAHNSVHSQSVMEALGKSIKKRDYTHTDTSKKKKKDKQMKAQFKTKQRQKQPGNYKDIIQKLKLNTILRHFKNYTKHKDTMAK